MVNSLLQKARVLTASTVLPPDITGENLLIYLTRWEEMKTSMYLVQKPV
jgi:hypothetical protein